MCVHDYVCTVRVCKTFYTKHITGILLNKQLYTVWISGTYTVYIQCMCIQCVLAGRLRAYSRTRCVCIMYIQCVCIYSVCIQCVCIYSVCNQNTFLYAVCIYSVCIQCVCIYSVCNQNMFLYSVCIYTMHIQCVYTMCFYTQCVHIQCVCTVLANPMYSVCVYIYSVYPVYTMCVCVNSSGKLHTWKLHTWKLHKWKLHTLRTSDANNGKDKTWCEARRSESVVI
jgi:hypothetical protein